MNSRQQSRREKMLLNLGLTEEEYQKKYPPYKLRNGRSWYRKADSAPAQEPGCDMLIGIQAIARFTGFSYSTIRKYIHQYGMPACALGDNRYRIHPESLFRWLESYSETMQEERFRVKEKTNEN